MSKIVFEDRSYIDCYKSNEPGKIMIVISAKDGSNPLKKITNACTLTLEELKNLIKDVA